MNKRLLNRMLALVLCAAGVVSSGTAQERRLPPAVMGVIGSYDYGHLIPINSRSELSNDPYSNEASSLTGGVTFIFPKIVANGFGLSTTFGYGRYYATFGRTIDETITDDFGNRVEAQIRHDYIFRSQAIEMNMLIYAHVGDIARFEVGPWAGLGFLPSYSDNAAIVSPSGTRFEDGWTTKNESIYASDAVVFNYGGMVRGSLEIPIIGGMSLLPFFQLRVGGMMGNTTSDQALSGTFGGGLGILFGQTNGVEIAAPPPPTSLLDTAAPAEPS